MTSRMGRIFLSVVATIALVFGATLVSAAPAQAYPYCVTGGNTTGATGGVRWSICESLSTGDTQFRVVVRCEENAGNRYMAYGKWARPGGRSQARCHEYAWLVTYFNQYR